MSSDPFHASGDQLQLPTLERKVFTEPNVYYRKAASGAQSICWTCMTYMQQVLTLGLDGDYQEEGENCTVLLCSPLSLHS